MPFTSFHFGTALPFVFWDYKKKRIDLISACIGSIIVDTRAIIIYFLGLPVPLHGILHNFIIATLLGIFTGLFVHYTQKIWNPFLKLIHWEQTTSLLSKILIASLLTNIHVLIDSPLYLEMNPFWPFLLGNPFFQSISVTNAYLICVIGFGIAFLEYIGFILWRIHNKNNLLYQS
ncbi:MAG: hypothetical protein ACTSVU_07590 [Promethearchaeota archaeon]